MDVEPAPRDTDDGLSPWLAAPRSAATAAFETELRGWLPDGAWRLLARRHASAATAAPTEVDVRSADGALVRLVLHTQNAPAGWVAGPITWTVHRAVDGQPADAHPAGRRLLSHLHTLVTTTPTPTLLARGRALHDAHHAWATLHRMEDRFYRHVERAHSGTTGLLRAGFLCNQDCGFCWQGRDWPAAPESLVFTWLDELAAAGVRRLNVCGGEPTLFRRLPELVYRAVHTHGMLVHLNTNAIRLRDRAYAEALRDAGLRSVLISLHSHLPELSDRLTGAPGTWTRTLAGTHAALDVGLLVVINSLVVTDNVHLVPAHARWVVRELVDGHPDNPVAMLNYNQPGQAYDAALYLDHIAPLDVARPQLTEALRTLHAAGVFVDVSGTCGFPACVAADVPELVPWRPQAEMDAYNLTGRTQAPVVCQQCAAFDQCVGARREYVARHGDRGFRPFTTRPTSDWYARLAAHPAGLRWGER